MSTVVSVAVPFATVRAVTSVADALTNSIAFSPTGDRAYVSVDYGPTVTNSVWVFDATQSPPASMTTIPTTEGPTGVTMRPEKRRFARKRRQARRAIDTPATRQECW